ncbi:unnamed protein product [Adineta steineri]|uniref:Uncharacterized protein n=1 Tax=Adineta steineri TaxID=433720 RepID=A0A818NGV3_9BILA|nr:unnamed protein product [Adineta steineri]
MATNKELYQSLSRSMSSYSPCGYLVDEPIQFVECGHRSCKGCFESRIAAATNGQVTCPDEDCNYQFDRNQIMLDRAFKRELDKKAITCIYKISKNCSWKGTVNAYQEHLDRDHTNFSCDRCQESFSSNEALINHQSKTCSSLFQRCPLAPHCGEEMIRKEEFSAHLLSEKHQEATALALLGRFNVPEISDQDHDMETNTDTNHLEEETSTKLSELADKVQKLNDDTVQLSRDFIKLNELTQLATHEVNNFQTQNTDRNHRIASFQPQQEDIQKNIELVKQNIEQNQHVSTDGTLTWRIDRVAEKMSDAVSERQTSIFSPIFYSSPYGYKMRARLYLQGDGTARRTHLSLFFLLMKGDYDALLKWPFEHKVTFCLFDQTGNNRHMIDSFRPDGKSASYQRPTGDANIATGIPKFCPLPMIQQDDNAYVRDDTLFLKIIVDLNETPKMILPFMLTLNPGLPNHVQQVLINQEKIKREQQNLLNASTATQPTPMNTCG